MYNFFQFNRIFDSKTATWKHLIQVLKLIWIHHHHHHHVNVID